MNKKNKILALIFSIFFWNNLFSMQTRNFLKITGLPRDLQIIIFNYLLKDVLSDLQKIADLDKTDISRKETINNWNKLLLNFSLIAHTKSVNSIAISTDNKILVSASDDKTVKFWDISHPCSIKSIKTVNFPKKVKIVSISGDKKYIAAFFKNDSFSIYDNETEQIKCKNIDPTFGQLKSEISISFVSFLPDNLLLMQFRNPYLSEGLTNIFFNITTEKFESVDSKLDYNLLALGNTRYALEHSEPIAILDNIYLRHSLCDVDILNYKKYLALLNSNVDDFSDEFESETNAEQMLEEAEITNIKTEHNNSINALVLSPNLKYLISSSTDKSIKIWFIF